MGPGTSAASSREFDLIIDSLKLIRDKQAEAASSSKLPHASEPGGVGMYGTDGKDAELNVSRFLPGEKDQFSDCYDDEPILFHAGEIKERKDEGKLTNNEGDDQDGKRKEFADRKSLFKLALAVFVKQLLTPTWIKGQIDREAYKAIVKKVVKKVISRVRSISIPQTQEDINNYLSSSGPNISKLVKVCAGPLK